MKRVLWISSIFASSLLVAAPACAPPTGEDVQTSALADEVQGPSDAAILTMRYQAAPVLDTVILERVRGVLEKARAAIVGMPGYGAHAFQHHDLQQIDVMATRDIARAWSRGETRTGVAALDALLAPYGEYSIEQVGVAPMSGNARFRLRFRNLVRTATLAADLSQIPGVIWADIVQHQMRPSDTDILLEPAPGGWRVRFVDPVANCTGEVCPPPMATEVFVGDDGTAVFKGRAPLESGGLPTR